MNPRIALATAALPILLLGAIWHTQKRNLAEAEAASPPGGIVNGFQLSVKPDKTTLESGQPITLQATLKNTTDKALYFPEPSDSMAGFRFTIKRSGNVVPLTQYGQKYYDNHDYESMSHQGIKVKGGGSATNQILISLLFDMTEEGTYSISVSRLFDGYGATQKLTAVPVKIQIQESSAISLDPPDTSD